MTCLRRPVADCARALVLCGLAAALAASAAEARSYSVLHSFHGADGRDPRAGLVADKDGNLYGTASVGGDLTLNRKLGFGTVFKIAADGGFSILHVFMGGKLGDGGLPLANLVLDRLGNLYGTTYLGGHGTGTVFKLAPDGTETIVHAFTPKHGDGALPTAGLIRDSDGRLYGTTSQGGIANCNSRGCGTVYKIAPDGTESLIYAFRGGSDGATPSNGALVKDDAGNFYGTTVAGGDVGCSTGICGVVYKLTPRGQETVLHAFAGGSDGSYPLGGLAIDAAGNLYGTTAQGGGGCSGAGCGIVFKIALDGRYSIIHVFAGGSDGGGPFSTLLLDRRGNLYGTTSYGGDAGDGTVFKLAPDGNETILHAFAMGRGYDPSASLVSMHGALYGTTERGGHIRCNCGVVFQLQ